MRVAIVDDEREVREQFVEYIHKFGVEAGMSMKTVTFASGDEFLESYSMVYDIIIFDIDMPGTNGIDTARALRKIDSQVTIMFVTNIAQYAINGYEVDAVDYIIKPIGYYDFSMKFHRTVSKAAQRQDQIINLEVSEGTRRVRVNDIRSVEVLSHYLYYDAGDKSYKTRGTMTDVEEELSKYGFVRIHRSYMINIRYVEKILSKEVTVDGKVLSVGRTYRDNLKEAFLKYVGGE